MISHWKKCYTNVNAFKEPFQLQTAIVFGFFPKHCTPWMYEFNEPLSWQNSKRKRHFAIKVRNLNLSMLQKKFQLKVWFNSISCFVAKLEINLSRQTHPSL